MSLTAKLRSADYAYPEVVIFACPLFWLARTVGVGFREQKRDQIARNLSDLRGFADTNVSRSKAIAHRFRRTPTLFLQDASEKC